MTVTERPSKELAVIWIAAPLLSFYPCPRAKFAAKSQASKGICVNSAKQRRFD